MNKKILFVMIFTSILLAGCGQKPDYNISIDSYEKTYSVKTGSVQSNDKYVGVLQSDQTTYLGFKLPGRITNLYVKEGSFVKKGQLLATLDGNEVKTQFSSAKQMLSSLWSMYKSTESMFDAQINSMKSKIAQAKAGMEGLKKGVGDTKNITKEQLATAEKQVNQAKIGLETAKANLEHTKQIFKQNEKDVYSNSKNAISNSKILLNNFLIFTDQLFGISDTNKHKNDSFENYLSAKNTALKEQIKQDWLKLNEKYQTWKDSTDVLLNDIKSSKAVEDDEKLKQRIYDNLQQTKELLVLSRNLAGKVYTAVDSSVSSRSFPQQMINTYKTNITSFQKNIEAALLTAQGNFLMGVKGSIQSIQNLKKQKSMKLDLLEKQYELAQAGYETAKQTYEQYKAMSEGKLTEIGTKYNVAKEQYDEALKGLKALKKQKWAQLSQIKSQINQVKGNKNLAAVNLGNIRLYAPYAGIITKKMADIGQVVGAGTPVFSLANPNNLKATFYVPIEDIKNIKLNDIVYIQALGTTLTGKITLISPSADMFSKKIPVEVKLKSVPKDWKLGMFVSGYKKNNNFSGIIIPQELIKYEFGQAYVFKKTNDKFEKTYIKLGKCDNNYCIVKNLNTNDIIK